MLKSKKKTKEQIIIENNNELAIEKIEILKRNFQSPIFKTIFGSMLYLMIGCVVLLFVMVLTELSDFDVIAMVCFMGIILVFGVSTYGAYLLLKTDRLMLGGRLFQVVFVLISMIAVLMVCDGVLAIPRSLYRLRIMGLSHDMFRENVILHVRSTILSIVMAFICFILLRLCYNIFDFLKCLIVGSRKDNRAETQKLKMTGKSLVMVMIPGTAFFLFSTIISYVNYAGELFVYLLFIFCFLPISLFFILLPFFLRKIQKDFDKIESVMDVTEPAGFTNEKTEILINTKENENETV